MQKKEKIAYGKEYCKLHVKEEMEHRMQETFYIPADYL